MPDDSIEFRELGRCLAENLNALRRLDRKDRAKANVLIDRIRNFIRSFREDLFQPATPSTTQPASSGSERDVTE